MTKSTPLIRLTALLLLLSLLAGCATMRANNARKGHIDARTHQHVYDEPCEQVWPQARQLLFEYGFSVRANDERIWTLETDWQEYDVTSDSANIASERYLVQGIVPDRSSCQVHFTYNRRSTSGQLATGRDLGLEWELIQRADPAAASRILDEADAAARAAR